MKTESDLSTFQAEKYPFVHATFGDALQLVSKKDNRDEYPLWWIISRNEAARREQTLKKAAEILNLKEPKQLKEHCEIIAEDLAGHPDRFRSFVAELHTLIELNKFHFKNFKKIPRKNSEPTPDYFAIYKGTPYVIEVCYAMPKQKKESFIIDGEFQDITNLMETIEEIVVARRLKFQRQLSGYSNHRKLAAMVYEGLPATAIFLNESDADKIWQILLREGKGSIDHLLISSMTYEQSSYIVPEL